MPQTQRRMTQADHAKAAAMNAPSRATIARVTAAYLPQEAVVLHDFTIRTGWRIRVYPSPWTEGRLIACAERAVSGDRPADNLDCEQPDLAAVKGWVKGLPV